MNRSESIKNIAIALCNFRKDAPKIERSKVVDVKDKSGNRLYTFHYAPFDDIEAACREKLASNGLCVIQLIEANASVETVILHESGEYISSSFSLQPQLNGKPQEVGSAITYARRYGYCAALGLVADEDDDGNASQGQYTTPSKKKGDDKKWLNPGTPEWTNAVSKLSADEINIETIEKHYKISKANKEKLLTESI